MSVLSVLELTRRDKSLGRVLPDRLEHPIPLVGEAQQALFDERLEVIEVGVRNLLSRFQPAAACEDGESTEERLLVLGQELVRPLDRRPERLLARIGIASAF